MFLLRFDLTDRYKLTQTFLPRTFFRSRLVLSSLHINITSQQLFPPTVFLCFTPSIFLSTLTTKRIITVTFMFRRVNGVFKVFVLSWHAAFECCQKVQFHLRLTSARSSTSAGCPSFLLANWKGYIWFTFNNLVTLSRRSDM